jgi:ubiquinone/menaquinone biosynthesis C-methylase UbiE
MQPAGFYDPERGYLGVTAELARLEAQVQVSWPQEERLLRAIGLGDGMGVLEVGCGPGFFTERLLTAFPSARVTATDVRDDFLRLARRRLRHVAPGRCRLLATSIADRSLDPDQFDFAIARFVLQHLRDPGAAAGEIRRLLRPGGVAAVIEVDMGVWGLVQPRIGGLDELYARAGRRGTDPGGNRLIARRLWRTLRQAGFTEVRLDAFVYHSDELGLDAFAHHLDPGHLFPAVTAGCVALTDYVQAKVAYEQFRNDPDAFVLLLGFVASGARPRTGGEAGAEPGAR